MAVVEVFSDIWCPFAYLGLKHAVAKRRELRAPALHLRAWPLELVNGAPMDAAHVAANATALRRQLAPSLFAGVDGWAFPATTIPGLALVAEANATSLERGEAVGMRLRELLFEEGADIADHALLADLARSFDLDPSCLERRDAVERDWHLGQARGVLGSPHFLAGASDAFCPGLDISRSDEGQLELGDRFAKLEDFLAGAFS